MTQDAQALQALLDLNALLDATVEDCQQQRLSLQDAMTVLLPTLAHQLGAHAALVHTFQEDLELATVTHPAALVLGELAHVLDEAGPALRREVTLETGSRVILARPLDVAGEWFGVMGLVFDQATAPPARRPFLMQALEVACEELDNFLHQIRSAREKHRIMMALGDALKSRVLSQGLTAAVQVLTLSMPLERLLITCRAEEGGATVHALLFEHGVLKSSTMEQGLAGNEDGVIKAEAAALLDHGDQALPRRFGFTRGREEVLINGITHSSVVGKILATNAAGRFNTHDRELLAGFSNFIRQRVVDFNKEYRTLARTFGEHDVSMLLRHDAYVEKFLTPREETVAILYVDIAGFTRLSEQVLKTPGNVAALVEGWSRRVVDLVWRHGGAFDKMVGDCVIALFGPPFYRQSHGERLSSALHCARAIRDMTTLLPDVPEFSHLQGHGLGVTTGVNLAPLFVGLFGPNDNFTGFSSGMNNTARLQGVAEKGEILVMQECLASLPAEHGFVFGTQREAKVKNVAQPLQFSPLV